MDISVSRLNNRLALQLPPELPLGLVFVLGHVRQLERAEMSHGDGSRHANVSFDLVEKGHVIRCRLSERAAKETALAEGSLIRAGGHLAFDPTHADYFLLARDVELIAEAEPEPPTAVSEPSARFATSGLGQALTDVKKRSSAVKPVPKDMPVWVQRMAPPGFDTESQAEAEADSSEPTAVASVPSLPSLDPKLVEFATRAMDSDEEVELTPELLDQLLGNTQPDEEEDQVAPPTAPTAESRPASRPAPARERDWVVTGLAIVLIVLVVLTIVIFSLLLLR